jgi:ketosteroid isomerase-like protein
MNKRETVQALLDAVQKGDFETAKSMLADDFRFSGPIPEPIDREAWLRMSANLKAAVPDLDYHFRVIGTQGDVVRATSQLSGTHPGPYQPTGMNRGTVSPTDRTFEARLEKTRITVKENQVTVWVVDPAQDAGMKEILDQAGLAIPSK